VYDAGPRSVKCPLICFPPASGTADVFFRQILALSAVGYRVIAVSNLLVCRAPDKLRICVFYAMKTSKNACIIISECTHYAYILLCKQTFQIRNVLVQSCT
jgi:hypothetical protein